MSEVVIGLAHLDARLAALAHISSRTQMGQLALSAVREEKLLVHRKTGFTARTISELDVTATGFSTVAHGAAPYLEFGTRPHEIRPKSAKVLRFATGGNATATAKAAPTPTPQPFKHRRIMRSVLPRSPSLLVLGNSTSTY